MASSLASMLLAVLLVFVHESLREPHLSKLGGGYSCSPAVDSASPVDSAASAVQCIDLASGSTSQARYGAVCVVAFSLFQAANLMLPKNANREEILKILEQSGLPLITASDLDDAAKKICRAIEA